MTQTALILAAGRGSRLGDLTTTLPKCLVKIYEQETFLSLILRNLMAVGVKEVVIVSGYQSRKIEQYLKTIQLPLRIRVIKNPQYAEAGPLASLKIGLEQVKGSCWLLPCDVIFDKALLGAVGSLKKNQCQLLAVKRPSYDSDSMKIKLYRSQVRAISKNLHTRGDVVESTGIALLNAAGRKRLLDICHAELQHNKDGWYHQALVKMATDYKQLTVIKTLHHFWVEIDRTEQYDHFQREYA